MRGRKPVPTVLKLLRGNPGKRPVNRHEPKPGALATDCPVECGDVPQAAEEWARTIVPAIQTGQITAADRVLAIAHCDLWATWRDQIATAAKNAHVIAGANQRPMQNPARAMANRTFSLLIKVDAELGLTPTSRSRVSVNEKDWVDLEAVLSRR